jgi:hypothetical protein
MLACVLRILPLAFWWLDLIGLLASLAASLLILYGTPTDTDIWLRTVPSERTLKLQLLEDAKKRSKLTKWGKRLLALGFLLQIPGWYLSKP